MNTYFNNNVLNAYSTVYNIEVVFLLFFMDCKKLIIFSIKLVIWEISLILFVQNNIQTHLYINIHTVSAGRIHGRDFRWQINRRRKSIVVGNPLVLILYMVILLS